VCSAPKRKRVSGSPISLFRLPRVASVSPRVAAMDASISLVVVLPKLPVSAITGTRNLARHQDATAPSARSVSATRRVAMPGREGRSTTAPAAPRSAASARKLCPSKRGPLSATNSWPGSSVRVSVATPRKPGSAPTRVAESTRARSVRLPWITTRPP
jgi:hypothetical protein